MKKKIPSGYYQKIETEVVRKWNLEVHLTYCSHTTAFIPGRQQTHN